MRHRLTFYLMPAAILGAGAIAGCTIMRAQVAAEAQETMIGMSKEDVLSCMGAPTNTAVAGGTEVWSYMSGDGHTDTFGVASSFGSYGLATAFGSSSTSMLYCKIDVVLTGGRVRRVNYSGPTGALLVQGEQCAYAVNNCAKQMASTPMASFRAPDAQLQNAEPTRSEAPAPPSAVQPASTAPASLCTEQERAQEQAYAREITEQGFQFRGRCN